MGIFMAWMSLEPTKLHDFERNAQESDTRL